MGGVYNKLAYEDGSCSIANDRTTHIPFLAVFIGVLGGLQAFGLVGLFVGPVTLAVMLVVWREWLETRVDEDTEI